MNTRVYRKKLKSFVFFVCSLCETDDKRNHFVPLFYRDFDKMKESDAKKLYFMMMESVGKYEHRFTFLHHTNIYALD